MTPGWQTVEAVLTAGVGESYPGAVAAVAQHGRPVWHCAVGARAIDPTREPNAPDTIYDLASLTKPVVAALYAWAASRGALGVDERMADLLPGPLPAHWQALTIADLLCHTGGLAAHRDFSALSAEAIRHAVFVEPPVAAPRDHAIYSDLGYMALGWALESRLGASLDVLLERARGPLELGSLNFRTGERTRVAPTERCARRGLVRGLVHDQNAWALGGVCGHAGLFGTASEVAHFADALRRCAETTSTLGATVRSFWDEARPTREPTTWRLGWDTPTVGHSSAGSHMSARAVGHLGFTGTSVWVDRDRAFTVVLLTNRVHPVVEQEPAIKRLRPRFHDAVVAAVDGAMDLRPTE